MKRLLITTGVLILGFSSGYFVRAIRGPARVHLEVLNSSGQEVSSMIIREEKNNFLVKNIRPGEKRVLDLPILVESSFKLDVTFQNGKKLQDRENYTEPGYTFFISINNDGIKTDVNLAGRY